MAAAALGGASELNDLSDAYTDYATDHNIFIGQDVGASVVAGARRNTVIGQGALAGTLTDAADHNTGLGRRVLSALTSGASNTAIGHHAMANATTGSNNVAIGLSAMVSGTIASDNVSLGVNSLWSNTEGNSNTAIGRSALYANTTGDNNIALGRGAGDNITTGSNNIIIGYDIDAADPAGDDQLNIGNLIYGDLANGDFIVGSSQLDNVSGTDDDARMFFDKSKAAFRAGHVTSTQWGMMRM